MLSILSSAVCHKCIPAIVGEFQSKSAPVRAKASQYIAIVIDRYPEDVLERYLDVIGKGLRKTLSDADPHARNFSRNALESLTAKFPDEAKRVFDGLDATTKKQLASVMAADSRPEPPGFSPPVKQTAVKKETKTPKQFSGKDEEEATKDSDKPALKTPNPKVRTQSALKKTAVSKESLPEDDPETSKTAAKHPRKKSITNSSKRGAQVSTKSIDKVPVSKEAEAEPQKSPGQFGKVPKPGPAVPLPGDFRDILHKLDSQVALCDQAWNDRMDSIRNIEKAFSGASSHAKLPSEEVFRQVLEKLVEKFEDPHAKVQEGSLKVVHSCFHRFEPYIGEHLSKVFCKVAPADQVVFCLAENKEALKKIGKELLTQLKEGLSRKDVADQCVRAFHSFNSVPAQIVCLQVLAASLEE